MSGLAIERETAALVQKHLAGSLKAGTNWKLAAKYLAEDLAAMLAAAPAPSSLAGGEVREAAARIEAGLERAEAIGTDRVLFGRQGPGIVLDDIRTILAALSPEAPDSGVVSDAIAAKYKQVKATTYTPGTPAERMKDGRLRGLNDALAIALIEEERAALTPPP